MIRSGITRSAKTRSFVRPSKFHRLSRLLVLWMVLSPTLATAAPPKVNYLYPAGAMRGQSAVITAAGEFPQWPIQAWSSVAGVQLTPEADKGKWRVTVNDGVTPGMVLLRMYDAEGATAVRPFMIGQLPEREESEPNDTSEKANAATLPMTWNGKLGKGGDVDCFAFDLQPGQTLVAAVRANGDLGSPVDAVLQLAELNARGDAFVVAQAEDSPNLDPRLVYKAVRTGRYVLRVFGFPAGTDSTIGFAGADTFVYRLTATVGGYVSHSWPLAVKRGQPGRLEAVGWNLSEEQRGGEIDATATSAGDRVTVFRPATASCFPAAIVDATSIVITEATDRVEPSLLLELPMVISAIIDTPGDTDRYRYALKQGQKVRWRAEARAIESSLDPHLAILDASGKQLAEADDTGPHPDSEIVFTAPADGEYLLVVSDAFRHGGADHFYRLSGQAVSPDFSLSLAADAVNVAVGKSAEWVVNIERKDGFNAPIEIQVEGLPAGVTVAAATSMPEGDSAKTVKLMLTADATATASGNTAGRIPVHVLGRDNTSPPSVRIATFVIAGTTHRSSDAWLTVTPAQ